MDFSIEPHPGLVPDPCMGADYSPYRHLAELDHLVYGRTDLPAGIAWWMADEQAIVVDSILSYTERRCCLAHHLVHAERQDPTCRQVAPGRPPLARTCDGEAERTAARKLITLRHLADVVSLGLSAAEMAKRLRVTGHVLDARLDALHPREAEQLAQLLNRDRNGAA